MGAMGAKRGLRVLVIVDGQERSSAPSDYGNQCSAPSSLGRLHAQCFSTKKVRKDRRSEDVAEVQSTEARLGEAKTSLCGVYACWLPVRLEDEASLEFPPPVAPSSHSLHQRDDSCC